MAKTIYTDQDIEQIFHAGISQIILDDQTILTDLAYEKAKKLGVNLKHGVEADEITSKIDNNSEQQKKVIPASLPEQQTLAVNETAYQNRDVLRFSPFASEYDLRQAIITTGRLLYLSGLMVSNDGNISVRMSDGNILITPSGVTKGRISEEDLLVIDLDGNLIKPAANPALKPTSEQPMHLEIYKQRPDVRAVIHTHLIFANALAISQGKVRMDVIPEAAIAFGDIPVTDFALPSSTENVTAIRSFVKNHDVMLIRNHGSLALGKNLDEALINTERLEHVSKTLTYATLLGDINTLPPEMLERIAEIIHQNQLAGKRT